MRVSVKKALHCGALQARHTLALGLVFCICDEPERGERCAEMALESDAA
eukprot:SAG11_NODE_14811_length_599_cov_0.594000_1_plen_48_part_10